MKNHNIAPIKIHPALLFIGLMMLAEIIQKIWPIGIGIDELWYIRSAGIGVIAIGILIACLAYWTFSRAGTNVDPSRPSTKIVSTGIYSFSRNPIYLGFCLVLGGGSLVKNSLPMLISSILLFVIISWAVILPEEAYLGKKFGDVYLRYKNKVRRWI